MDVTNDVIVPFGKYKGKHISSLLADKAYLQWCKNNNIITEQKYPHIYNTIYCVNVLSNTEDTPTPEHNDMQNRFLDKHLQVCLLKYLFQKEFHPIPNLFTAEVEQYYGSYNDTIDNTLLDCIQSVTFEEKFNWDVVLNVCHELSFKSIHYQSFSDAIFKHINKIINTYYDDDSISSEFFCEWLVSCDDIDVDVKKKIQSDLSWFKKSEDRVSDLRKFYKTQLRHLYLDIKFLDKHKHKHCYLCDFYDGNVSICCEIKPTLGDDYPCVLRKMIQQIEHTKQYIDRNGFHKTHQFNHRLLPILVVKDYNSKVTSFDKLKTIFKQHKITVVLLSDINNNEKDEHHSLEEVNKLLQEKVQFLTAENDYLRQQLLSFTSS